jgi:hypothetical protein
MRWKQFLRKLNERYDLDKIAQLEPFIVKFMDEQSAAAESTEQPTAEILKPGTQDLIAEIAGRLNRNESISWQELDRMADAAFGGSRAAGRYEPKDMYDAMEAAVVRHLNNFEHEYKLSDDPANTPMPFWENCASWSTCCRRSALGPRSR